MNLPDLLIIADFKQLQAYIILPDGLPEVVENVDFENDGPTSVPLVEWSNDRDGYRAVAEGVAGIVARYQPDTWGLACPLLLGREIIERLPPSTQASLVVLWQIDVAAVDISNVLQLFDPGAKDYGSEKEHC
ncbi:MAG: hypothetical protein V4689_22545 [Verrucomicrobiota bacterium]